MLLVRYLNSPQRARGQRKYLVDIMQREDSREIQWSRTDVEMFVIEAQNFLLFQALAFDVSFHFDETFDCSKN